MTCSSPSIVAVKTPWALASSNAFLFRAMSSGASPCSGGFTRSLKIRGELTTSACSGWASGTLMTSIRNSAELGSLAALDAAGELAGRPHGA